MENKRIYIIKRSFEEICRCFLKFIIFFSFFLFLAGCQIVEPEKRAYPLAVGLDRIEGKYQVSLGMAQLAETTGQGKEGGEEQQGNGEGALVLKGGSKEEILKEYNRTRELYLDPGHVQAVILSERLIRDEDLLIHVLMEMEKETALGNSAYVFRTENPEQILEQNGEEMQSLGEFLAGIYENRTEKRKPVTLGDIYRKIHNQEKFPSLPEIGVQKDRIFVENK